MKKDYILLSLSAILYAVPFLFSVYLWWFIFVFPVPLLYAACTHRLSFKHGYWWGFIVFLLHLSVGIFIVADLAGDWWWIGFLMGILMVMYQALMPALLFLCADALIRFFSIKLPLTRILLYAGALVFFIVWVDRYCMWIFGTMEGYPLVNPLILLVQYPSLLCALPIVGKHIMVVFFLLVPTSITLVVWYKNYRMLLFCASVIVLWVLCALMHMHEERQSFWRKEIKSLPCMIRVHSAHNALHILLRHIKKLIAEYPETTIVVMPESALDMIDEKDMYLLSELHIGKKLHVIFGSCYYNNDCYYNALYWVYDGILQVRFDKRHAMLITERLCDWMNYAWLRKMYFKNDISITRSGNIRMMLPISQSIAFTPYICSELFFNEYPDDFYGSMPVIAIVNDTLLAGNCLQELILLLARFRAIQWQRDIIYVSYNRSVFIDRTAVLEQINN